MSRSGPGPHKYLICAHIIEVDRAMSTRAHSWASSELLVFGDSWRAMHSAANVPASSLRSGAAGPSCQRARASRLHPPFGRNHLSDLGLHRSCSVGRSNPVQSTEASDRFGTALTLERRVEKEE
jgi:hypothetical protein